MEHDLFNQLAEICRNSNGEEVYSYYEKTCGDSLSDRHNMISAEGEMFHPQFIYFVNEEEKIIYIEHGWERDVIDCIYHGAAHQILFKFKEDYYHYDAFTFSDAEYPNEDDYDSKKDYEEVLDEYYDDLEKWNSEHEIIINTSDIFEVLKAFDEMEQKIHHETYFSGL